MTKLDRQYDPDYECSDISETPNMAIKALQVSLRRNVLEVLECVE